MNYSHLSPAALSVCWGLLFADPQRKSEDQDLGSLSQGTGRGREVQIMDLGVKLHLFL